MSYLFLHFGPDFLRRSADFLKANLCKQVNRKQLTFADAKNVLERF
jgi:hypothetical protein